MKLLLDEIKVEKKVHDKILAIEKCKRLIDLKDV